MAEKLTRRAMLQQAAAVGGAAGLPARSLAQIVDSRAPYENLDAAEARTLEAIVARLIPADENGPGALEAGAARYIDRALSNALARSLDAYRSGLAAVDVYARSVAGGAYADLDPAAQDRVLGDLERNVATGFASNASAFFDLVLGHTLEGTFCDPHYGGNQDFIGWELIGYPGIRLAVAADEQRMSARPELNRVSAYDLPMFDPDETGAAHGDSGGGDAP